MTDPFELFAEWMDEARESELNDPDAMAFATADAQGRPSVRIVLMRRYGPEGFGFFTNLKTRSAPLQFTGRASASKCAPRAAWFW
jgi:pyridoxamine 5'-phosphate oxidase